jgi:ADP-ribose pyrophosphatase YjhB (NUDIX family)
MKNIYSRIHIPKHMQEFFIDGGYSERESSPKLDNILDIQAYYVERAMEYQANLVVVGDDEVYMRCQEQKKAGKQYPGVGVGAIVTNSDGKILLTKRGPLAGNRVGEWENPGGTQEVGESLSQAAERETREETGYLVKAFGIVSFSEELLQGEQQHWNNFGVLCEWYGKRSKHYVPEQGKISEIDWFDPEELPQPMSQGALAVISDYVAGVKIPINRVSR